MVNTFEFNTEETANSWALILGGSSGLGFASAKKLAAKGLHLCIVHRTRRSKLEEFNHTIEALRETGIQIESFNLDALNPATIDKVKDFFTERNASVKVLLHSIAKGNLKPIYAEDASVAKLSGKVIAKVL